MQHFEKLVVNFSSESIYMKQECMYIYVYINKYLSNIYVCIWYIYRCNIIVVDGEVKWSGW